MLKCSAVLRVVTSLSLAFYNIKMNAAFYIILLYFTCIISAPRTTKGRDLLYHNGYEYKQKGLSANHQTQFWNCVKNSCNGRVHTPANQLQPVTIVTKHNHPMVEASHEARLAKEAMKETARHQPEAQPRNIISGERIELSDEARMHLPSTSTLQRTIERQREVPNRQGIDAKDLVNVEINVSS